MSSSNDAAAPRYVEIRLRLRIDPGGQGALSIEAPGVHPEQVHDVLNRAVAFVARTLVTAAVLQEIHRGAGPRILQPGEPPLPPGLPLR